MFTCPRGDLWCRNVGQLGGTQIALSTGSFEDIADDDDVIASPEWLRAQLALEKGDFEAAIEADRDALRFLEQRLPRHPISLRLWLIWEILVQLSHCLLRRWLVGKRVPDSVNDELFAARHFGRLAKDSGSSRSIGKALWLGGGGRRRR